jgi:hypothetical protein
MNSIKLDGILADKDKPNYSEIIRRSVTFYHTSVIIRRQLTIWATSQIWLERTYVIWSKEYLCQGNSSVLR